ncbi:actin cytoskeleton and mitosis protein [Coemansia sp. RSA 1813]|nr:actin cytoskeleton and mitosis protein [Coemansia sp. RSA 1646]KAJ1774060.1 actin cytoskeleton and mitosis protein [Coemansia sp. RSA 1843]KAJ2216756.1 actin cytoskeleton and mitosis protein [Coemansia sp. RSA 487]KAJ2572828.1 actin cytoskeleton and mitosis protein [Coemansia sp. RSA 1813]
MDFGRTPEEEARLKALRRQRFSNTETEQQYKKMVAERAQRRKRLEEEAIATRGSRGKSHRHLPDTQKLIGTCTLMCPEFERKEREMKNALAPQEFFPGTRKADPARTVKTFHRSAAGNEEPLPEDLRTPETLLGTLDYLVDTIIAGDQSLVRCHGFVRDRTRSIRQDFTIQNIRDHHTVAACERIARFHILSLHVLCGHKDFEEQQDMEQLRNTLKTLIELYDDHRKAGAGCPNEAEFYAYYIVSHLHDSDAKRVAERLPKHIFLAPVVQQALRLHMLSESSNVTVSRKDPGSQYSVQSLTTQFFRAVASSQTPLLLACLAEYFFPRIRRAAIKAMNNAFPYQQGKEYPVDELAAMYAFDSVEEVREFCAQFGLSVTQRGVKLGERAGKQPVFRDIDHQPRRVTRNIRVVGAKFHMTPMLAINATLQPQLLVPGTPSAILKAPAVANGPASLALGGGISRNRAGCELGPMPAAQHNRPAPQVGLSRAAKEFVPDQPFQRPPLPKQSSASAFASTFTGILDQKPRVVSPAAVDPQITKTKKRVSFAPGLTASASTSAGPSQPLFSSTPAMAASNASPTQQGSASSQQHGLLRFSSQGAQPNAGFAPTAPSLPEQSKSMSGLAAAQINTPAFTKTAPPPPAAAPAPTTPPAPEIPPPDIVWNKPRHRINWTSLSNALYYNLVESLLLEAAEPTFLRSRKNIKTADALAVDITSAIVDYTSAFIAYEESYRCVLHAQADAFRQKSLLRGAFSRWSMESVMVQQDRILQQQYLDDLDELIDSEYMVGHQHRVRSEIGGSANAFSDTIDSQLGLLPARGRSLLSGFGQSPEPIKVRVNGTMPAGFWDSAQLGREGFESLCKALRRYGDPAFRLSVTLLHTQPESVLHSWLWWQIDPSSISQAGESDESARLVVYSNIEQVMTFREYDAGCSEQPLSAQIVLLSPEPLEAKHLGGNGMGYSMLEDKISSCVEGALELARARASDSSSGGGGGRATMPLLFIFWYTDSRLKRSVRRMVENTASSSGIPSFVSINVLALEISNSKQQLIAGMKWMYKQLYQSLKSSFVRVTRAYAVVSDTAIQSLRRMRNCIVSLLRCWPSDTAEAFSIFNDAVSVANAFIEILNTHVFVSLKCPRACQYPHLSSSQALGTAYFGQRIHSSNSSSSNGVDGLALFATNLVVGATVDEILCNDTVHGSDGAVHPTLGACMRAFELVVKNQLDVLQQSLPADIYTDKQIVSVATKQAVQMSNQLVEHAARLCQQSNAEGGVYQDPFTTPRPKRSLSLAFSNGSPPLSLFSAASDAEDTPESTAPSVMSISTQSTAVKRQRASPSFNLSKLQGAIARASRHLK